MLYGLQLYSKSSEDDLLYILAYIEDNCNYNCSYCYNIKPYTKIQLNLIKLYKYIQYIKQKYPTKYIQLELIGGEPTLHPDLLDFCQKISKLNNIYMTIYTNFSKDIDFYKTLLSIDSRISLILSWHSLNKNFKDKFDLIPNIYIQHNIIVSIIYEHNNINSALNIFDYIKNNYNDIKELNFPLIEDNKRYCTLKYTVNDLIEYKKRLQFIKDKTHIKLVFNDKSTEIVNQHYFITNDENKIFTRWLCYVGTDFCFIYFNGDICPCDGYKNKIKLGNLYSDNILKIKFNKKIFCEVKYCPCVFDVRKKLIFKK